MFNTNTQGYSLADIAAATGSNRNTDGAWGDGNGAWWIIILFLFAFAGGWGNGYGGYGGYGGGMFGGTPATNTSVYEGYVLNNDMSMLSRQVSDGFSTQERKLDSISNGICSLGYDQLAQMNGINTNIMGGVNTLQAAIKDCCCTTQQNTKDTQYLIGSNAAEISRGVERGFSDTNYNLATQANGLTTTIANGFCQTNFNAQTSTRDIIDSGAANTRAILDKLCQMEVNAKDEKIADLTARLNRADLAASQAAQNTYLISELKPCPHPAYVVPNPYCNCNCGYNNV